MSLCTGRSQKYQEVGLKMTTSKSLVMAFQDLVWLLIVLLIFVTTIAAAALASRPGLAFFDRSSRGIFDKKAPIHVRNCTDSTSSE
jgi:hypothetical protein